MAMAMTTRSADSQLCRGTAADWRAASASVAILVAEDLGEALLGFLGVLLDVLQVDLDQLERLEFRAALRRRHVVAGGVESLGREQLLGLVAQHELGEQLRRVRVRR